MPEHLAMQLAVTGVLAVVSWALFAYYRRTNEWPQGWMRGPLVALALIAGTLTSIGFAWNVVTAVSWLLSSR